MGKVSKTKKHNARYRIVSDEKIEKLNRKIQERCKFCIFDCVNEINLENECKNRVEQEYSLNELIELMKEENVNLYKFVDDYNLKFEWLVLMLRSQMRMKYKYLICILDRLNLVPNGIDKNQEYQQMLKKESADI